MNSHPPSLRREIVRWYSLVLVIALSVFAALSYLILRQTLERTSAASLQQTASAAEQLLLPAGIPRIAVREERVEIGREGVEALRRRTRLATGDVFEIYVARSDDVEDRALRSFVLISVILIPLTAVGAALGGWRAADRLLRPLNRLVAATREIEIGALSRRVDEPERPAELRELAQAFNGMLTRLDEAVDALRRFTADASHELRTPLTAIRGTAQVAISRERDAGELRGTIGEILEEAEWMLHTVEGLLTLAREEETGARPDLEPLDLVPLLADVREVGEALAAGKPVDVRLDSPETLVIRGSVGPLRRVFLNLVSNAVKFTDTGRVRIRAQKDPGEHWVEVSVEDTGRGIPTDELTRVFDRFYRGPDARGNERGTGLGLAIARVIVSQHGGAMEAESVVGEGSTFRVRLPLSE